MTLKEEVLQHKSFFSLMYSPVRAPHLSIEEQIVEIETSKLEWYLNNEGFTYTWGWPGPDFNSYTRDTYGKGWAYTKEEIIDAWSN